jgi:beta-lactamase class D
VLHLPKLFWFMRKFLIPAVVLFLLHACSPNNVNIDNSLQTFFDSNKVQGTFGMFNNGSGTFTVYNMPRFKDSAFSPASTFKIVNTLIGLETGRLPNDSFICKWDGQQRMFDSWEKDMTYYEAFRLSCLPCYQELARRIGQDTMQKYLDTLFTRTQKITTSIDQFWLDNSMKVTCDQQLGLMKKLYFGQLPFQDRSMRIVRNMMLFENTDKYALSYKTGLGSKENGNSVAWIVGWIEENKHPYFFVLNLESADKKMEEMVAVRMNILKGILKQQGFMLGNK